MITLEPHTIDVIIAALLTFVIVFACVYALLEIIDPEPRIPRDPPPELKPDIRSVQ